MAKPTYLKHNGELWFYTERVDKFFHSSFEHNWITTDLVINKGLTYDVAYDQTKNKYEGTHYTHLVLDSASFSQKEIEAMPKRKIIYKTEYEFMPAHYIVRTNQPHILIEGPFSTIEEGQNFLKYFYGPNSRTFEYYVKKFDADPKSNAAVYLGQSLINYFNYRFRASDELEENEKEFALQKTNHNIKLKLNKTNSELILIEQFIENQKEKHLTDIKELFIDRFNDDDSTKQISQNESIKPGRSSINSAWNVVETKYTIEPDFDFKKISILMCDLIKYYGVGFEHDNYVKLYMTGVSDFRDVLKCIKENNF